jgi:peptidoglycan/LPS O-acetylase OafA/YrhL
VSTRPSQDSVGGFESAAGTGDGRFRAFDGLRAIAALAVLVTHAGAITGFNTRSWAGPYTARAEVGVPVFFVISGFLLYRPIALAHLEGRRHVSPLYFWRRRASRIFPAYWVALTFVPIVTGHRLVRGAHDVVVYYGLLQIYDKDRVLGGLFQAWSLCTELGFYLLLPLYAAVVVVRRRSPASQLRVELAGIAILYAASVAFRVWLVAIDSRGPQFTWTLAWLDVFALGMAMAVVSAWTSTRDRPPALVSWVGRHPGACWLVAAAAFVALSNLGIPRTLVPFTPVQRLGGQLLAGVVAVGLVAPAAFGRDRAGLITRLLTSRVALAIGLISYSFYLWHAAMLERAVEVAGRPLDASLATVLALGLALTLIVAAVSYRVIERPVSSAADAGPVDQAPSRN